MNANGVTNEFLRNVDKYYPGGIEQRLMDEKQPYAKHWKNLDTYLAEFLAARPEMVVLTKPIDRPAK